MEWVDKILTHYLIAALWSSTDNNDNPLDDNYDISEISSTASDSSSDDIIKFLDLAGDAIDDIAFEQIGHDFWLTRNRHGAGFWDRGYSKKVENRLMEACSHFSEIYPVVSDDGIIYFE